MPLISTSRVLSRVVRPATVALIALLSACDGGPSGTGTQPHVVSIRVPSAPVTIDAGHSVQLIATPLDAAGKEVAGAKITWDVPVNAIVSVSNTGWLTGLLPGVDTVYAQSESVRAAIIAVIGPNPATQLSVSTSATVIPVPTFNGDVPRATVTAVARNKFGEIVSSAGVEWTSSNPSILPVSPAGVVTAVGPGTTEIVARLGSLTASIAITANLIPVSVTSGNTNASGTAYVRDLNIGPGATITVVGGLSMRSDGPVVLAGNLVTTNLCSEVSITSASTVTITGAIDVWCPLRIVAARGIVVSGATIRSVGGQYFSNDITLGDWDFSQGLSGAQPSDCEFTNAKMEPHVGYPATASGGNWEASCRGNVILAGSTRITAEDGMRPREGVKGAAGIVRVRATGDVIGRGGPIMFRAGNGGDALPLAISNALPLADGPQPTTESRGFDGGNVGWSAFGQAPVFVQAGRDVRSDGAATTFSFTIGRGGTGGSADAAGYPGRDATATTAAQGGGAAIAVGGNGGSVFAPQITAGGSVSGIVTLMSGGNAGNGGSATAVGGKGGAGSATLPHGGAGGMMTAIGGNGGVTAIRLGVSNPPARGGDAGGARWIGGGGGNGWNACALAGSTAGNGGVGGAITGGPGVPGAGEVSGTPVTTIRFESAANGGAGGNGPLPGVGGNGGPDTTPLGLSRELFGVSFAKGASGTACPPSLR